MCVDHSPIHILEVKTSFEGWGPGLSRSEKQPMIPRGGPRLEILCLNHPEIVGPSYSTGPKESCPRSSRHWRIASRTLGLSAQSRPATRLEMFIGIHVPGVGYEARCHTINIRGPRRLAKIRFVKSAVLPPGYEPKRLGGKRHSPSVRLNKPPRLAYFLRFIIHPYFQAPFQRYLAAVNCCFI